MAGGTEAQFSALWGQAGETWSASSRLPDFSFAGYRFGEVPLPDVAVVSNVRDFGAKGDGAHDDTQAFKDAIARTEGGAIFIPPGRYVVTDILWIEKSNLVLRGAGAEQTVLVCPKSLEDIASRRTKNASGLGTTVYSWAGGIVWVRGPGESREGRPVTAEAARGGHVLAVESTRGFRVGERVMLRVVDDEQRSLLDYLYAGDPGDVSGLARPIKTSFVSRVTAVSEREVTLERPLPFDVRLAWSPALAVFAPEVSEVGIEALSFEFPDTPYRGHFTEAGHNAIAIERASDCWIRDVHIQNSDSGVFLRTAMFCTVDGLTLDSVRQVDGRGTTGHHGLNMGIDCLAQNFDFRTRFIHDITVDADDVRNVVKNGRGVNLSLDHHKRVPYANLFCNLDAGEGTLIWKSGGGKGRGKHSAAWATFWNIRAANPMKEPDINFGPPLMNFVGLFTEEPSRTDPAGRWFEAIPPEQLRPADLHAAQLERRLKAKAQGGVK